MIGIKNIIPEGMRDFTIDECKRRNNIISTIKIVLKIGDIMKFLLQQLNIMKHLIIKLKALKRKKCINSLIIEEEY